MAKPLSLAKLRCGKLFAATFVFSIFANLLKLTGPLFMLQVYDRVLGSRSVETLTALFILVAALFFLYGLLEFARGRVAARVGARFQSGLNDRVFDAVLRDAAQGKPGSTGANALQDLAAIGRLFASPVLLTLFDVFWTPVFLLTIFIFHPMLGWLAVVGGCTLITAAIANQVLSRRRLASSQHYSTLAARTANQVEQASQLVLAQGMGGNMRQRWRDLQQMSLSSAIGAGDVNGLFSAFTRAFRLFVQSAMLALGAWLVLQNQVTAGAMIAASLLLGGALAPIEQGIAQWPVVHRARSGWGNLSNFLTHSAQIQGPTPLPVPAPIIRASNLSVVLRKGAAPVLQNISFCVHPGQALGVIGKSGAGKTTLARALVGLVHPTAGDIRLGGAEPAQYGAERYGELIGYMPQDVHLFEGSIAQNIARMSPDPDPGKVVDAAQKARIHYEVLALPDGYDTVLGVSGFQLSGGQKQRLCLARAFYNDPILLVLDEPNSSLDADGEAALNQAISDMKDAKHTVIIIGHRPSAISQCDQLLVLEAGKSAAYGHRDEVLRATAQNAGDLVRLVREKAS